LVLCHTHLILGCSLIGGDGFLLSQDQPVGTELQLLPNPGSPYIPVFRLTGHSTCHLVARWFAGLFFEPEDGGAIFLRNVVCYTTDYTASYPRRWYSEIYFIDETVYFFRAWSHLARPTVMSLVLKRDSNRECYSKMYRMFRSYTCVTSDISWHTPITQFGLILKHYFYGDETTRRTIYVPVCKWTLHDARTPIFPAHALLWT
jgi:hypothetical protein